MVSASEDKRYVKMWSLFKSRVLRELDLRRIEWHETERQACGVLAIIIK